MPPESDVLDGGIFYVFFLTAEYAEGDAEGNQLSYPASPEAG